MITACRQYDMARRNAQGRSRWVRKRRANLAGFVQPDPRNQEQHDLAIELEWRRRVAQRSMGARP